MREPVFFDGAPNCRGKGDVLVSWFYAPEGRIFDPHRGKQSLKQRFMFHFVGLSKRSVDSGVN